MRFRPFILGGLALLLGAAPVYAASQEELEETKQQLEASRRHEAELAQKNLVIAGELKELQNKLVALAEITQKTEADLNASEEKMRILDEQLAGRKSLLDSHRQQLAALIDAALKLSRTPPEAVIMMPGDSRETMKAAGALKMISKSIHDESAGIRTQVEELSQLKTKVANRRSELAALRDSLAKQQPVLTQSLKERQALLAQLATERETEAAVIAQLAKKAEDLEGLMQALDQRQADKRAKAEAAGVEIKPDTSAPKGVRGKLRSFAAAKGKIRPPIAGRVIMGFGVKDRNDTSKGLTIAARERATVTATYDGEVVYSGSFLGYGQMVILRHSDEFHTLLAGLDSIDVSVGQFLLEGEPIGAMGDKDSGSKLYVELRRSSRPIDPSFWISGLNRK